MSFKFFRKNQKIMLWFVVVLAIFTFTIFSVQSTMKTCFTQEIVDEMGEYTLKDGTKVKISLQRWRSVFHSLQSMAILTGQEFDQSQILPHLVIHEEASRAGLSVSDMELQDSLKAFFRGNIPSPEEYRQILTKGAGFHSVREFEDIRRELLVVDKFKGFHDMADDLFLTEEIYEKYKVENEELKLDYLAFKADDFVDQVDVTTFEEKEIEDYYKTVRPGIGQEELTVFEKFLFDFAYVDTEQIDFEAYAELTADVTIDEREVERYFGVVKERYKIEKPDDAGTETESPAGETDETAEEPAAEYKELAEVKDDLEKELKVLALIDKAEKEWTDFAKENDLFGSPAKKDEAEKDDDASRSEADAPDADAFFQSLCDKYKLSRKTFEEKLPWDTLDTLERFGSDGFKRRIRSVRKNYSVVIKPCADCVTHVAFLVRVKEKDEAKLKDLSDVRDLVVEDLAQKKRMELAEAAANDVKDAMRAKVRAFPEVATKVDQIMATAREETEKRIKERQESQEDYTEEMAERYREGSMRSAESEANRELDPLLHRVFDETCAEKELTPVVVDYFPKTEAQNRSAAEDAPEAEKFLKARMGFIVSQLEKDAFSNPLRDNDGNTIYLVRMLDRRFPPPSAMSKEDITKERERIEMDKMIARWQARQGAGAASTAPVENDPFAMEQIIKDYNVQFYQRGDAEEEAPAEE